MTASEPTVPYLPWELWFETFTYLPGNDIIHFLSSSRTYRALVTAETVWHELCSRYGVRDLTHFKSLGSHCSFYTVYTKLLHTYGPLLGLWASDNPFEGNILEFRITTDPGWVGIVGEVWRFEPQPSPGLPAPPDYYECLRIELLPSEPAESSTGVTIGVQFSWTVPSDDDDAALSLWVSPTNIIRRFTPHRFSFLVRNHDANREEFVRFVHPPFPPPALVHSWSDPCRLPRLIEHEEVVVDTSDPIHTSWIRASLPIIYISTSPDRPLIERSITVLPPPCAFPDHTDYDELHAPPLESLADLRRLQPLPPSESINGHYFPLPAPPTLRQDIQMRQSADGDHWTPQSLEGLWLGSYQEDSTEVISLKWDAELGELQAWKVTGNCCVPRGAITWSFKLSAHIWASKDLLAEMGLDVLSGIERSKLQMFEGVGVIADEGFVYVVNDFYYFYFPK